MKTYRVTVDGQAYEVTVEEVKSAEAQPASPRAEATPAVAAPKPVASPPRLAPKPAAAPVLTLAAGERPVPAPMPGKILAVNVVPGDAVAAGTVLLILEAMKMENDILAPADGKVKAVKVQNGDTVNTGDLMIVLE
jgi:glutaconyl-CoA/methylmalonyl-CoA decarboxylase subunit gamma